MSGESCAYGCTCQRHTGPPEAAYRHCDACGKRLRHDHRCKPRRVAPVFVLPDWIAQRIRAPRGSTSAG